MEKFTIGLLAGMVGGALLVANNYKMRALVRKGQDELKTRLDEMLDEKMKEFSASPAAATQGGDAQQASGSAGASAAESGESGESRKKAKGKAAKQ